MVPPARDSRRWDGPDGRWPIDSRRCPRFCGSASVFMSPAHSARSLPMLCPVQADASVPLAGGIAANRKSNSEPEALSGQEIASYTCS